MPPDFSILIPCLFCNNYIRFDVCVKCNIKYNFYKNHMHSFYIAINDFDIHYDLDNLICIIYDWNWDKVIANNIPMDKLLLPLPELKEKINNMLGYL